jgi:S1-C subfamily serine protease
MPIKLKCPSCGHSDRVSDDVLGKKVTCPSCGTAFRVAAPKPSAAAQPAPAPTQPRPPAASPDPFPGSTEYAVEPAIAPVLSKPAPPVSSPRPTASPPAAAVPKSGGLPPWAYAAMGGGGVTVIVAFALLIRYLGGSGPTRVPDPAAEVAVGAASGSGSQTAQPAAAPTATEPAPPASNAALAAGSAALSATTIPVAGDPPLTASSAPAASNVPAPSSTAPAPTAGGAHLTTAEIVARWEPSVALVKGHSSSGTGFVIKPGVIATNSHVINEEFISSLEVRFPSAPEGKQGPFAAELLFEDPKRDLAFLAVSTDLAAMEVAPSYSFIKGEDITVIGNPGLGDEVVLENAISRGVMSAKTVIEGMNYFQMSMAVNPGNSGGPVFDSAGRVIGVVTLKSSKAEAMAFCIPVEELRAALATVGEPHPDQVSQHRALVAFKHLTVAGALYGIGLDIRAGLLRTAAPGRGKPNLLPNERIQKLDETINTLDQKLFTLVDDEIPEIKADALMAELTRNRYQDLSTSYKAMKDLYNSTNRPPDKYATQVQALRAKYLRLVESLQKDLKIEVPPNLIALLKARASDDQSQTLASQIVPARVQSRLRSRGALPPRGAIGARPSAAPSPGQSARDRMQQNLRDRRNKARGNN